MSLVQRPIQTNEREIRTINGRVAASGSIVAGQGFSVVKNGTGLYTVALTKPGRSCIGFSICVLNATGATGHFGKALSASDLGVVQFGTFVADATDGAPSDEAFAFSITVKDCSL